MSVVIFEKLNLFGINLLWSILWMKYALVHRYNSFLSETLQNWIFQKYDVQLCPYTFIVCQSIKNDVMPAKAATRFVYCVPSICCLLSSVILTQTGLRNNDWYCGTTSLQPDPSLCALSLEWLSRKLAIPEDVKILVMISRFSQY